MKMETDILWQIFNESGATEWPKLCFLGICVFQCEAFAKWRKVLFHGKDLYHKIVSEFSNAELLLWLRTKFPIGKNIYRGMLIEELYRNRREKLLCKVLRQEHHRCVPDMFTHSAEFGQLNMLKWLINKFNLNRFNSSKLCNLTCMRVAELGNLDVLKWLLMEFDFTPSDREVWIVDILDSATRFGNLEIVKWLVEDFYPKIKNNRKLGCELYRDATNYEYSELAKYVNREFRVPELDQGEYIAIMTIPSYR